MAQTRQNMSKIDRMERHGMAVKQDFHRFHRLSLEPFPAVTISHYRRFRPDERHVTRISREYVLIFMLEGTLHFSEEGVPVSVAAGEWYLQVPGLLQSASRGSPAPVYYFVHFTGKEQARTKAEKPNTGSTAPAVPAVGFSEPGAGMPDPPASNSGSGTLVPTASGSCAVLPLRGTFRTEALAPLFERLEGTGHPHVADRLQRQSVFLDLLSRLSGEGDPETGSEGFPVEGDQAMGMERSAALIRQVVAYLGDHVDRTVPLTELSDRFHFSADALIRSMKRWTGHTPGRYHRFLRLERAKWLLENTDDPLPSIGRSVGYQDVTLLHKAFRASVGMTPGEWRKRSRGLNGLDQETIRMTPTAKQTPEPTVS